MKGITTGKPRKKIEDAQQPKVHTCTKTKHLMRTLAPYHHISRDPTRSSAIPILSTCCCRRLGTQGRGEEAFQSMLEELSWGVEEPSLRL